MFHRPNTIRSFPLALPLLWIGCVSLFINGSVVSAVATDTVASSSLLVLQSRQEDVTERLRSRGLLPATTTSKEGEQDFLPSTVISGRTATTTSAVYQAENSNLTPTTTSMEDGWIRSGGLTIRLLAQSGMKINYTSNILMGEDEDTTMNNLSSDIPFHSRPANGAIFMDERAKNRDGYIYVSNANDDNNNGGVGAITFDKNGNVIHYTRILTGTNDNWGGIRTPWNTWISCENTLTTNGTIYQVDPYGYRESVPIALGKDYDGGYDSFAYDIRDRNKPYFFVARDHTSGAIHRYTPNHVDWMNHPWDMLLQQDGAMDYLVLQPTSTTNGTYEWIPDKDIANRNAKFYYPNSAHLEIPMDSNYLQFISKTSNQLFIVHLDAGTYTNARILPPEDEEEIQSQGLIQSILTHNRLKPGEVLYVTEKDAAGDGTTRSTNEKGRATIKSTAPQLRGRDMSTEKYETILKSSTYLDEITGLVFSPNRKHLYVAYEQNGLLFDVARTDGYPLDAATIHNL